MNSRKIIKFFVIGIIVIVGTKSIGGCGNVSCGFTSQDGFVCKNE